MSFIPVCESVLLLLLSLHSFQGCPWSGSLIRPSVAWLLPPLQLLATGPSPSLDQPSAAKTPRAQQNGAGAPVGTWARVTLTSCSRRLDASGPSGRAPRFPPRTGDGHRQKLGCETWKAQGDGSFCSDWFCTPQRIMGPGGFGSGRFRPEHIPRSRRAETLSGDTLRQTRRLPVSRRSGHGTGGFHPKVSARRTSCHEAHT